MPLSIWTVLLHRSRSWNQLRRMMLLSSLKLFMCMICWHSWPSICKQLGWMWRHCTLPLPNSLVCYKSSKFKKHGRDGMVRCSVVCGLAFAQANSCWLKAVAERSTLPSRKLSVMWREWTGRNTAAYYCLPPCWWYMHSLFREVWALKQSF